MHSQCCATITIIHFQNFRTTPSTLSPLTTNSPLLPSHAWPPWSGFLTPSEESKWCWQRTGARLKPPIPNPLLNSWSLWKPLPKARKSSQPTPVSGPLPDSPAATLRPCAFLSWWGPASHSFSRVSQTDPGYSSKTARNEKYTNQSQDQTSWLDVRSKRQ